MLRYRKVCYDLLDCNVVYEETVPLHLKMHRVGDIP